jgi:hypothetical protein
MHLVFDDATPEGGHALAQGGGGIWHRVDPHGQPCLDDHAIIGDGRLRGRGRIRTGLGGWRGLRRRGFYDNVFDGARALARSRRYQPSAQRNPTHAGYYAPAGATIRASVRPWT